MVERKKAFSNTLNFMRGAYEESFIGEMEMDESRLDKDKPYTRIGRKYYQAEFAQTEVRPGEIIPIVSMPIDPENPDKFRPKKGDSDKSRRPNAALLYIFADTNDAQQPYQTLSEIGALYGGLTRELIRQDVAKHTSDMHKISLPQLKASYPLDSLDFRRPMPIASRQRISQVQGGRSLDIFKRMETESLEDLKKDYTTAQIVASRTILKRWGTTLEREWEPILPRFEVLANLNATDKEIQAFLDSIAEWQIKVLRKAGLVVNLTTLAKKAGIYAGGPELRFVAESLDNKGVPQTTVPHKFKDKEGNEKIAHYRLVAAVHEGRGVRILRRDHALDDLRINPVRQIAGPKDDTLPNTGQLKRDYDALGVLIGEIRGGRWIGRGAGGITTSDIIKGSPVELYIDTNRGRTIGYDRTKKKELKAHLERRMRELGMI